MSKWTYSEDVELYNKVDEYGKKWTIIQRCNTMLKHVKRLFIWHVKMGISILSSTFFHMKK